MEACYLVSKQFCEDPLCLSSFIFEMGVKRPPSGGSSELSLPQVALISLGITAYSWNGGLQGTDSSKQQLHLAPCPSSFPFSSLSFPIPFSSQFLRFSLEGRPRVTAAQGQRNLDLSISQAGGSPRDYDTNQSPWPSPITRN